ncbi:hypothetical protein [Geodermatophilus normandii]|uniref:Uncharacterized protein n=1 Tax=Geodermatophilus normandii TaxID=1137989 RepID=A0A6P0GDW9_9ACTN|nr:hypothetical protein [Geodermatophilus normandii]NEM04529.1 hypothetical protein [Geodermatophilus normandii]
MVPRGLWAGVSMAVGLVVGAGLVEDYHWLEDDGSRRHVDLGTFVDTGGDPAALPGGRWVTGDVCDEEVPCIQAVRSDALTVYRFADRDDAVALARSFAGDAYLSGWIVVRFEPGALTAAERVSFASDLDCINVGVAEGGLEC